MKRLLILNIILLLVFTLGCETDDSPTTPTTSAEYEIVLESLPDSLLWLAGTEMTIPVNALVLHKDGGVAPDVRVELALASSSGSFDSPGLTTDQHGRVSAVGKLTPVQGIQTFSPLLIVPGGSATGSIVIRGVREPSRIAFDAPNTTFKVAPGATIETTFKATFSDSNGVGIAGLPVRVGLKDISDAERVFGAVSAPGLTDERGELEISFNSLQGLGRANVYLESALPGMNVGTDTALTLKVQRLTDDIGSLTVRAFPNFHHLEPDELGASYLRALVRDVNNVGIPDIMVNIVTDLGVISRITPTDSNGVVTVHWQNNYEGGIAHILASIPGTEFEATTQIVVDQGHDAIGILQISTDVPVIYADGGLTVAHIRAWLKDYDHQAIADVPLVFTSTHGAINSPVTTNEYGVAEATFTDVGIPSYGNDGSVVPAKIYVKYDRFNAIDSCEVTISPRNPVSSITLTSTKYIMQAGSGDSCTIRATAILANGNFASPGTTVYFEISFANGHFNPHAQPIGRNGVAETIFTAGNFVGTAVLRAYVINDDDSIVYSNELRIELLPGPPNNIRLTANPSELDANDPVAFSTIIANVTDSSGNPVAEGTLVQFETTLGTITPTGIIGEGGLISARLYPNGQVGIADVRGYVTLAGGTIIEAHTSVIFISGVANSIRITASPVTIQAAETGGISNSTITATVIDGNGVPINYATKVYFELPNEPELPDGCTWPNRTRIDSVRTANGVAAISLNAGLRNGPVFIKAYTWRDDDRTDTVRSQGYFVTVEGGEAGEPPLTEIGFSPDGEDAGGGLWRIPVYARLMDENESPWPNRVPVGFTIVPDDAGVIDPGMTGNDIGFGVEPGVAWTWLAYHSVNSMDVVSVEAEIQLGESSVTVERRIQLPLQDGSLEVNVDPQNWLFNREAEGDSCLIRIWAQLTDGHQIGVGPAEVEFNIQMPSDVDGYFYRVGEEGEHIRLDPPFRMMTDDNGLATIWFRGAFHEDGFLPDPVEDQILRVFASVVGYEVEADPGFIFFSFR